MASVSDIHNFDDQFQYQLQKLDEADIDDRDRKAIKDLIRYQDTQRGLAASTNVNNCSDLRLSAERADTPLVDMDREDVDALLFEYKHNYDMAKGTLRNYRKAIRKMIIQRLTKKHGLSSLAKDNEFLEETIGYLIENAE